MPVFRSKWLKNHTLWGGTYLSLNWCKLWPIVTRPLAYRYIDRASTDTGRCIDRNLIGSLLVNYRWRIGHLSVLYQSIVERWSTDIYYPPLIKEHLPTHHRYFIDILSLLDRHTWKKSISYRFRNRRHVGISTANHASLLIIAFHRVLKCDVIKMKFLKLWDLSGYSERTMSKRTTCQKWAFRGKLSLRS